MRRPLASLAVALVGALSSCADPAPDAPDVPVWTVEEAPALTIGEVDGPPELTLTNVLHGTVLSDGTVVVQNSIRNLFEIRYYRADGTHLRTVSRWGKGPFEFHYTLGIFPLPGDSVLVAGQDDRFAVFGPRGERVRAGRLGLQAVLPTFVAQPIDQSTWLALKPRVRDGMPEPGFRMPPLYVLRHDRVEARTDTMEVGRGGLTYIEEMEDRVGIRTYPTPFSSRTMAASGAGRLWIGNSWTREIRGYTVDSAEPVVTIQLPGEFEQVDRFDRSRMQDLYAQVGERWERYAASVEFPDVKPLYEQLKVDRSGMLWVQHFEPPWAQGPQGWSVYAQDGSHMADVMVPPGALPRCSRQVTRSCWTFRNGFLEIGEDYLLVTQRDDLGVPYVLQFSFSREEGEGSTGSGAR